jgi:hypothetical protein
MAHKIITAHFTVSGAPTTGLSPIIDIYELDLNNPNVNTLVINNGAFTEIGIGWYRYDFLTYDLTKNYVYTIDGGAALDGAERWKIGGNESYIEDISSGVWEEPNLDHVQAGTTGFMLNQIKADTTSISIGQNTLTTLVNIMLKYERNRTKIDTTNATLTIYNDDGTTPLTIFNLKDHLGNPSIAEVAERVPQ